MRKLFAVSRSRKIVIQNDKAKLASVHFFYYFFMGEGGKRSVLSGLIFSVNEPYKGTMVCHCCHFESDETASLS